MGIYPEWRTVLMEQQPKLGDDDVELWEQEVDYKIDYQDLQLEGVAKAKTRLKWNTITALHLKRLTLER